MEYILHVHTVCLVSVALYDMLIMQERGVGAYILERVLFLSSLILLFRFK